jgi:hypothetical protein
MHANIIASEYFYGKIINLLGERERKEEAKLWSIFPE